MRHQLRRVSLVIMAMFASLFVAATGIQFVWADQLSNDPKNVRILYDSYKTRRGAILVDGKPIAQSLPVGDNFFYQRTYTDEMYSAATGFYSIYQGAAGMESALNSYLTGQNSSQFFEQINALFSGNPVSGANVELTIDPSVQKVAWDALGRLSGSVVAIEPSTGKILAFVSKPGFDANLLADHSSKKAQRAYSELLNDSDAPLVNRAIAGDLYVPGSVFKLVVASAALQSGDYTAKSELPNPSRFKLPNTDTYVYNSGEGNCGGKPTVTIEDALKLSCNVPFAQLGIALGQQRIRAQAEIFGFGKNLKMPMTVTPSVYPKDMDDAQTGLSAFGQFDDRVTPLQVAMISSAIANGGVLMKPNLVENVQSSTLSLLAQPQPQVFSQPVTSQTAESVKQMMISAVSSGVSSNGQIPGVKVAGKTGTAQNGSGQPYTLWFTGFAPADNPQVAVAVVVEDGGGMGQSGRGNTVAAPIARKVMQAVIGR